MLSDILLEIKDLHMHFAMTTGIFSRGKVNYVKALDRVSFFIRKGEVFGLAGESGCGKTTLGKCILQLYRPTSGKVLFEGVDLCQLNKRAVRQMRTKIQMIPQDPFSSLDPRMTVRSIIGEPLRVYKFAKGNEYHQRIEELLNLVRLSSSMANRYPHEFSGGQRQRISIARALAMRPSFMVCDEPVSCLDVSIQAQIVNLLMEIQQELGLTYLVIGHDLAVLRHMSDRVAIMYLGRIVEIAPNIELFQNALHPYTKALLSAIPIPNPVLEAKRARIILSDNVPSPTNIPQGCNFHTRCYLVLPECSQVVPQLRHIRNDHWVACNRVAIENGEQSKSWDRAN
jgi:oligopeptide transport system ATP-binding protein